MIFSEKKNLFKFIFFVVFVLCNSFLFAEEDDDETEEEPNPNIPVCVEKL